MNLRSSYQQALDRNGFLADEAQKKAIDALARIGHELTTGESPKSLIPWLRHRLRAAPAGPAAPVRGAYLWGGVGRGKTFMMDLFFEHLPEQRKLRYHFHRLMYRVHGRLKQLGDREDPLSIVAGELSRQARVICFDEFSVSDITDAMILARLLQQLFERGTTLVTTSNVPPDDLYQGGLQRERFLPAIDLIHQHTDILHVDGPTDYRLRVLEQAEIWHSPLDDGADRNLERYFSGIAPDGGTTGQPIEILGRQLHTRRRADGIAWFDFAELCDGPRSQNDYIELARCFQTILVSGIPVLDQRNEDQARRFIALVDEFYERRVKLIASAAGSIEQIYTGSRLAREFERTRSRLREMQSTGYLGAVHIA